jgi:hypothetical protein
MILPILMIFFRQESSEDEYEENDATAKKLGMVPDKKTVVDDKKQTGIQASFLRYHKYNEILFLCCFFL